MHTPTMSDYAERIRSRMAGSSDDMSQSYPPIGSISGSLELPIGVTEGSNRRQFLAAFAGLVNLISLN